MKDDYVDMDKIEYYQRKFVGMARRVMPVDERYPLPHPLLADRNAKCFVNGFIHRTALRDLYWCLDCERSLTRW